MEEALESKERDRLQAYMKKHNVEDLIQTLVEGLLKDKPEGRPEEHWAHMLRMDRIATSSHKDEADYVRENTKASEVPGRLLAKLFEGTKAITSEIVPKEAIRLIIEQTIKILNCDRVSLFIYDKNLNVLKLNSSNLKAAIRVKPGQGIAGLVFESKETVNIPDCYSDARFDQTFDKMTGYTTKHSLTMPIVDFEGTCLGVLQAINKLEDDSTSAYVSQGTNPPASHFTHVDEILMENLTQHVSVSLRNADLYRAAIVTSERSKALLSMIQSLSQDLGAQSTILTITMHANQLVQADRCTVFLVDESKQQLSSVCTDSGKQICIPKSAGIAGECATEGKLIVIDDCYADARFNQKIDKLTGYRTVSMLAVPVLRRKARENAGNVLAVIQMINKMEFDGEIGKFDEEDLDVMASCTQFISSKLEGSSLLEKMSEKRDVVAHSEGAMAFDQLVEKPHNAPDAFGKRRNSGSGNTMRRRSQDCAVIVEPENEDAPQKPVRRHSADFVGMKSSGDSSPMHSLGGGAINTMRRHSQDCKMIVDDADEDA